MNSVVYIFRSALSAVNDLSFYLFQSCIAMIMDLYGSVTSSTSFNSDFMRGVFNDS